jgi:hypothetical protein
MRDLFKGEVDMNKVNVVENIATGKKHICRNNKILCGYKPYDHEKSEKLELIDVTCKTCKRIYGII